MQKWFYLDMERVQVLSVKPTLNKDNLSSANSSPSLVNLKPSLSTKKHSFSVRKSSKANADFGKRDCNSEIFTNRDVKDPISITNLSELSLGSYSGGVINSYSNSFEHTQLYASCHQNKNNYHSSAYYSRQRKITPKEPTNSSLGTNLYRSNSSLELKNDVLDGYTQHFTPIKREYGSHGSININSKSFQPEDNLLSLLKNYSEEDFKTESEVRGCSPKGKLRIYKLWDRERSIFKKFRTTKSSEKTEICSETNSTGSLNFITKIDAEEDSGIMEEQRYTRRTNLAHFDCQSLASQLSTVKIKALLADRSNTTTGASAAAMAETCSQPTSLNRGSVENMEIENENYKKDNHMLCSCPYFRNELGGDGKRIVSLSRDINKHRMPATMNKSAQLYRTTSASSIGLLDTQAGHSHWTTNLCPYINRSPIIEAIDQGSTFYKTYFQNKEHQNWFGIDEALGPIAISIRKEKQDESPFDKPHSIPLYQYRIIIRTSELFTCQGTLKEESHRGEKSYKSVGIKEVLEYLCPQLNVSHLKLGINLPKTEEALLRVDDLGIHKNFKVGVLYCRAGQSTEEEMYNNELSGPALSEFLELLGQRVRLKDFEKYRGGLDKKTDSTGYYSVYTQYHGCEIMFHVSTLLPYTASNSKQLLRKRHIGNDIVTIIFQEPGAKPFSPKYIRSHFQHVFIVVQAINPCTDNAMYSIAVSRFQDVPMFGPPIPEGATFPRSKKFIDILIAKVINGELAALRSEKFSCMAARTKHEYLKDLATNHVTNTVLDTASKFSLKGFARSSRKDKSSRFKFVGDMSASGALSWNVILHDATLQENVDSILAVSVDSIIILEEASASVVFSTSTKSALGWLRKPSGIMLFYHQGECLSISIRSFISELEDEEILTEIEQRLQSVTQGAEAKELILRRNSAGLLGFNVQQDGIITEVEPYGLAAQAGLQQGSRIVEICKVTLATLSQEQMVDLLKTSQTVSVTVIPPHKGGSPRRGCNVPTCSFLLGRSEGDYENLTPPENNFPTKSKKCKHLNRYERSFTPPHSAMSSGYGTGNSSHSFSLEAQFQQQDISSLVQTKDDYRRGIENSKMNSGHFNSWTEPEGLHKSNAPQVLLKVGYEYSPPALPARLIQKCTTSSNPSEIVECAIYEESGRTSNKSRSSRSEDDLSLHSKSNSPYSFQKTNTSSSSPSLSRNQSPSQGLSLPPTLKDNAIMKKSQCQVPPRSSNSSNLKEELMRLINPDYLSDCESLNIELRDKHTGFSNERTRSKESISSSNNTQLPLDQDPIGGPQFQTIGEKEFTSRKSVFNRVAANPKQQSLRSQKHVLTIGSEGIEKSTAIVTSDIASLNLLLDKKESETASLQPSWDKEHHGTAPPTEIGVKNIPLPAAKPQLEDEWISLVNTATNSIVPHISPTNVSNLTCGAKDFDNEDSVTTFGSEESLNRRRKSSPCSKAFYPSTDGQSLRNQSYYDSLNSNTECNPVPEYIQSQRLETDPLESRLSPDLGGNATRSGSQAETSNPVHHLQQALVAEQHKTEHLENEVSHLKTENRKLQEDSRAAAQQLHQFTEWFFNTIDKT